MDLQKTPVFILFMLFLTMGLNGVIADEYNCAATETETPYKISDTAGKINGYTLHGGLADDEANYYVSGYKSSSDQVIFKLQASDMSVLQTYDIDETQIPDMFASDGLSISNESGTLVAYGWDSANENDINKYVFGTGATSIKFTDVKGGTGFAGEQMYHGFAINKNGSTTDAPTKYYITVPVSSSSSKVYECDWDNTNTCVQLTNTGTQPIRQQGSGIEYQTNDTNQELILMHQTTPNPSIMHIRSFDAPTFSSAMDSTQYTLNSSGFPTSKANGIAQISSTEIKAIYEKYPADGIWVKTFTACETLTSGVFVSVEEFDNANQAKAANEGTDYAVFDSSALLGWQAYSFIDTLTDFDGEYSFDGGSFTNIVGLQSIGDADAGYVVADFGELFDTTTYRDGATDTSDWDTGNARVRLDDGLIEDWDLYSADVWTSPQPAAVTIVANELKLTSTSTPTEIYSQDTSQYKTFNARIKVTDNVANIQDVTFGFRHPSLCGQISITPSTIQSYTHDGVGGEWQDWVVAPDTNYHDFQIVATPTSTNFYYDGVLKTTHTTRICNSTNSVGFIVDADVSDTINTYVDYVYVDGFDLTNTMQTTALDDTTDTISKFNFSANESVADLNEPFDSYSTAVWTDPQPAWANIVSNEIEIAGGSDYNILGSSDIFGLKTLNARVKFTDNASLLAGSGIRFAGTGAGWLGFDSDSSNIFVYSHDGTSQEGTTVQAIDTNYHDIKIVRDGSTNKFYFDGVLVATHSTYITIDELNIWLLNKGTGQNMYVDYIMVGDDSSSMGNVTYDVSCDGGSNWETDITENTAIACAVNGSDLRVKANLSTLDDSTTPTISNFGINYTTDGTDPTTPGVFGQEYYSYDWDTSTFENGQYKFKMTATDDDSPANEDDDTSQTFTICHGDTIQAFLHPDLTTDIYTALDCSNEIEVDANTTDDIKLKIVNQDTNAQNIDIIISNTINDNRHYYAYECTDDTFTTCTFNSTTTYGDENAGNGLKTWDPINSLFTHRITDTYTSLETKYIKLEYRTPYYNVEMAFDEDANFTTFYGLEETDTTTTGCTATQPCTHATVTAVNNWQTKSLYDITGETAIIRFTAWTDAATSKEIEVAFEQVDGIQEFTTMEIVTITSTPQTYTVWLSGIGICEDGNECKLNLKTNLASGSYNLYVRDVFIEPDSYFTQMTHLLQSDYTELPAWLISSISERYINEGAPFRVDSGFYDIFGELASYKIEGFVATDSAGTSALTGLSKVFTLTPTIETYYDVDYLHTPGVISLDSTYDYLKVVVTVYDASDTATEMQTEYVQFHNYPFFENDAILTITQSTRSLNTPPTGTVTLQITEPQNLNAIKIATCEGKTQPGLAGIQGCIDNAKIITEHLNGIDFTCDGNTCIFDYTQNNYVFETQVFYTTIAFADLKTCEITSCGNANYINGLSIYRIIQTDSDAEVSFEVPIDNVVYPANFGNYSTYGHYMGNWDAGALIPTAYRMNFHAILFLENGEYDFTKYVFARARVLTTGEVVESPDFYPIRTSYDYEQKTGHYWFSNIFYDTSGNFFPDLTNHLLEVSFSDESDKAFSGLISVQNPLNFDDNATVALDSEIELLKFTSLASLSSSSFAGTNYVKNVNMADELILTIHNENSSFDDQKTDRQNQFNRFVIPTYVLVELPADYNLTVSEFQEKTADITGLDLQVCLDEVEYSAVSGLTPIFARSTQFQLVDCYVDAAVTGFTYWVGSLTKPVSDAIQFKGFVTSFNWRVDGFQPYDKNVLNQEYSDVAATDINLKIDEQGLSTGQGNITLNVGKHKFTQQNNLVYGSSFAGTTDANATVLSNKYNITVKLVYDDFRKSKSMTTTFAMRDDSINEEADCWSLTHLERGDSLGCQFNAWINFALTNIVVTVCLIFIFVATFWAIGKMNGGR